MSKVKLGDVVERVKEFVDKDNTDLTFYIGGEHFESRSLTIKNRGYINGSTIGPAFHHRFRKGDVLLMSRNPHLRKAGMVDFDGICSDVSYVIRTKDENVIMQKFIPLLFQCDTFWEFAEKNKKGSTNFFLNWSDFEKFEFDLPAIEKQKKIVDVLWSIDNTIDTYNNVIKASDELVKSQFIEMFGEIGKDEKGWGLTTLGKCCELNPKRPKDIDDKVMVSFVPMPAVSDNGKIDCSEIKPYRDVRKGFTYFAENDVIFAKITPCMENGKGAIARGLVGGIGSGSTEFHILRPIIGKSNPYWLYVITKFKGFRDGAKKVMTGTGGQLRVPIGFLRDYPVSLPPIELQNDFEKFVQQVDKSKFEIEKALNELKNLYQMIIKQGIC